MIRTGLPTVTPLSNAAPYATTPSMTAAERAEARSDWSFLAIKHPKSPFKRPGFCFGSSRIVPACWEVQAPSEHYFSQHLSFSSFTYRHLPNAVHARYRKQAAKRMAEMRKMMNVTPRAPLSIVVAPMLYSDPRNRSADAPRQVTGFCSLSWSWDTAVAAARLPSIVRRIDVVLTSRALEGGDPVQFTLRTDGSAQPAVWNVGFGGSTHFNALLLHCPAGTVPNAAA